jgi:hypothetical protein
MNCQLHVIGTGERLLPPFLLGRIPLGADLCRRVDALCWLVEWVRIFPVSRTRSG